MGSSLYSERIRVVLPHTPKRLVSKFAPQFAKPHNKTDPSNQVIYTYDRDNDLGSRTKYTAFGETCSSSGMTASDYLFTEQHAEGWNKAHDAICPVCYAPVKRFVKAE